MQQIHDSGYSNIRPLNEGGMGTLFLAHKDSLDIDVVIKRVKRQFRGRMNERAEADILKKLKHKYLPRIYDIILSPDGYMDTIMDYIQGVDMQRYVKQHGPVGQKLAKAQPMIMDGTAQVMQQVQMPAVWIFSGRIPASRRTISLALHRSS